VSDTSGVRLTEEVSEFRSGGTRTGKLGFLAADGRPLVAPVWFLVEDGQLVFNTGAGTARGRALLRDTHVVMCVDDEAPPYPFVQVQGIVSSSEEPADLLGTATRIAALHGHGAGRGVRHAQCGARRAGGADPAHQDHRGVRRDGLSSTVSPVSPVSPVEERPRQVRPRGEDRARRWAGQLGEDPADQRGVQERQVGGGHEGQLGARVGGGVQPGGQPHQRTEPGPKVGHQDGSGGRPGQ
jgi:PPOX class probable F420-dependent enzyme